MLVDRQGMSTSSLRPDESKNLLNERPRCPYLRFTRCMVRPFQRE